MQSHELDTGGKIRAYPVPVIDGVDRSPADTMVMMLVMSIEEVWFDSSRADTVGHSSIDLVPLWETLLFV